jgi:hypothetical protein
MGYEANKFDINLITKTIDFFKLNKSRKKWDSWLDDEPTFNFVNILSKHPQFQYKFDFEFVAELLYDMFNHLDLPNKTFYSTDDAEQFLNLLLKNLDINITDYWVILPLNHSIISEKIEVNKDICVIGGTREEKIDYLCHIIGINKHDGYQRFSHTETSRSPNFFSYPLLVIKIKHLANFVYQNSTILAYYAVNFLNLLYWAYVHPQHRIPRFKLTQKTAKEEINQHLVIQTKNQSNWRHRPLDFVYTCPFNIDWLDDEAIKKKYIDLLSLVLSSKYDNELTLRFLRAVRFFTRSISINTNNQYFENYSDSILYLNIAAECVLLKNGEKYKTKKITRRLTHFVQSDDFDRKECLRIIKKMCKARGEYVHEGVHYFESAFDEKTHQKTELEFFKTISARFLSEAFNLVNKCIKESAITNRRITEVWFELLNNI